MTIPTSKCGGSSGPEKTYELRIHAYVQSIAGWWIVVWSFSLSRDSAVPCIRRTFFLDSPKRNVFPTLVVRPLTSVTRISDWICFRSRCSAAAFCMFERGHVTCCRFGKNERTYWVEKRCKKKSKKLF